LIFYFFAWETRNRVGRTGLISFFQYTCLVFLAKWVARPTRARDVLICCWDWPNNRPAVVNVIFIKFCVFLFLSSHWPKVVFVFLYSCPHYLLPLISILAYRSASPTWLLISCLQCPPFFFFFIFRWKNHHNLKSLDFIWSKERNKHKRSIYTFGHCWPVSLIATKETTQFLYERNNIINREYETSPPPPPEHINRDRNWS
jgi:hypothetical protein